MKLVVNTSHRINTFRIIKSVVRDNSYSILVMQQQQQQSQQQLLNSQMMMMEQQQQQ